MAAKKSESVEGEGAPGPGSAFGDGGVSVQGYFQQADQKEGSRRNPKQTLPPKGESDLVSTVEACKLMNGVVGYLMYDPAALYRDAGNTAPSVHEVAAGALRFSKSECLEFAQEWKKRKAERARLKAEEAEFASETEAFYRSEANGD